jgi:hypothetical protein
MCTGMPFALIYMMTHLEFLVDEEMLKIDNVEFAATPHLKLILRIDKIKK